LQIARSGRIDTLGATASHLFPSRLLAHLWASVGIICGQPSQSVGKRSAVLLLCRQATAPIIFLQAGIAKTASICVGKCNPFNPFSVLPEGLSHGIR
jgi:hypothetical protein